MSFTIKNVQARLTFNNNNVLVKNCDYRLIIIFCCISAVLPIIKCAKLENPQIRLLINDDDLLQEKTNVYEGADAAVQQDNSGEDFNLYRSELKRLSYETIHRILRDENEPSYRREETELRYYQKRSPSYEENHQLIKRSAQQKPLELNLSQQNLSEFLITPQIRQRLESLSVLDLSYNSLRQLNIEQLNNITSLTTLNLKNNNFTCIPLERKTTLRTLNLNNNFIKDSNISSNIYVRNLHLAGNVIENMASLQLDLIKNLETLDVSHNLLKNSESSFFMERMHNLKHLNLAFNNLCSIYRETFYNLLSLNTLLLAHNNITDIDYETFLALPNLQFLDLSFNNLQGKSIRALQGITGLVALNMAFNPDIGPFMQEFVASWSLKELDASGTGLCQIPAALAQSVRSLKLTHNWLKVINCGDLDSYPLLQYLDLSFSQIEEIEDDAVGRLEILEILMLDHNKLRKVPVSLPVSLEHLFLQNNDILEIPQQAFQGLINLKTLDLSYNKLLYLPNIMLPKLQTLNLQSSEIRGISQGIIHSLPKLNELMLEDNPIKCADLLGIAEWASTCRLRTEKETDLEQKNEQDLKSKYEKMHNFYDQFGLNDTSHINHTISTHLKVPPCLQDYIGSLQQMSKNAKQDKQADKKLKTNKMVQEMKFTLQPTTPNPLIATTINTTKNFVYKESIKKHPLREVKQQKLKLFDDKNTVKTFHVETSTQPVTPNIHSSNLFELQPAFFLNLKSSKLNTSTATNSIVENAMNEEQRDAESIFKPKKKSEMKTFDHLAATRNANSVATTIINQAERPTSQRDATIGSTPNMTEIDTRNKQRISRLSKILPSAKRKGRVLTNFPFSVESNDLADIALLKHNKSKNINSAEFIESTAIATPINSEKQATTTFRSTAAVHATTSMTEAFTQALPKNKHDNLRVRVEKYKEKVKGKTSNLQINLEEEIQKQKHRIESNPPTTEEIKSLATQKPKIMQTKIYGAAREMVNAAPTTSKHITKVTMAKRTLKIPPHPTLNLDDGNKELNGYKETTTISPSSTSKTLTQHFFPKKPTKTTTQTHKPAMEQEHKLTTSFAAAILKTSKTTIEQQKTATEIKSTEITATATTLVNDRDAASNYNDTKNNRQITETINKTSNILVTTTTTTSSNSTAKEYQQYNEIAKTFNNTATANAQTTTAIITSQRQRQRQRQPAIAFQHIPSHYSQPQQQNVIVKCTPSTSRECDSASTTPTLTPDKIGRTPIKGEILEQATASKTSTQIPEAAASITNVTRKHEPLQLLAKDRHLIGTPLLMHKGENLLVTADELILPTNNHNVEQEENNNSGNNTSITQHHATETNSVANDNKYEAHLALSQTTKLLSTTTEEASRIPTRDEHKINKSISMNLQQDVKVENAAADLIKINKPSSETKAKNPSLSMKKMTIITKQHEDPQYFQSVELFENEAHGKTLANSNYQELKPLAANLAKQVAHSRAVKHSTVNTPLNRIEEYSRKSANLLKQPQTFQHEHELLLKQILHDQQVGSHEKLTKSEQWSDLRKIEKNENHPGLILLVSSGLFLVLLVGLMHVYRCEIPWRRPSASHHMRPHQRQNQSLEDDSHSFLSYSEGMQKWHHSIRQEAPYKSPLHNLHVRELQKTSATEEPATVKSSIKNSKSTPLSRTFALENSRSLSQSSPTTTSTASGSSSAILDDESFYIEMTPDSGQFARALQAELLPMELLNKAHTQSPTSQPNLSDCQTSMADECRVHHQYQPQLTTSKSLPCEPSSTVKPPAKSRRFRLW